jgi:Cd2+/Zn2+-exporting ATPase
VVASHTHFDAAFPHDADHCRWANDDAALGRTPVLVSADAEYRGTIALMDTVRPTAASAIGALRADGMEHVAMLTGDHAAAANDIAAQTGVTDVRAGLLPQDKIAAVEELRAEYGPIAMVGDGINDAPALARADVGIALGTAHTGTAQAMETADVSIMSEDLGRLPFLFALARAALRTIQTNIAVSVGIKLVFILLVVAGMGTMWMAVLADVGTSLLVTLYGMRLLGWNMSRRAGV